MAEQTIGERIAADWVSRNYNQVRAAAAIDKAVAEARKDASLQSLREAHELLDELGAPRISNDPDPDNFGTTAFLEERIKMALEGAESAAEARTANLIARLEPADLPYLAPGREMSAAIQGFAERLVAEARKDAITDTIANLISRDWDKVPVGITKEIRALLAQVDGPDPDADEPELTAEQKAELKADYEQFLYDKGAKDRRITELEEQLAAKEAEAGVMREALSDIIDAIRNPMGAGLEGCLTRGNAALSSTAGEALLARLRAAEADRDTYRDAGTNWAARLQAAEERAAALETALQTIAAYAPGDATIHAVIQAARGKEPA